MSEVTKTSELAKNKQQTNKQTTSDYETGNIFLRAKLFFIPSNGDGIVLRLFPHYRYKRGSQEFQAGLQNEVTLLFIF